MTLGIQDGPAALLVNGNILFGAGIRVTDPSGQPQARPPGFTSTTATFSIASATSRLHHPNLRHATAAAP